MVIEWHIKEAFFSHIIPFKLSTQKRTPLMQRGTRNGSSSNEFLPFPFHHEFTSAQRINSIPDHTFRPVSLWVIKIGKWSLTWAHSSCKSLHVKMNTGPYFIVEVFRLRGAWFCNWHRQTYGSFTAPNSQKRYQQQAETTHHWVRPKSLVNLLTFCWTFPSQSPKHC